MVSPETQLVLPHLRFSWDRLSPISVLDQIYCRTPPEPSMRMMNATISRLGCIVT